jgi:hypothetical protein
MSSGGHVGPVVSVYWTLIFVVVALIAFVKQAEQLFVGNWRTCDERDNQDCKTDSGSG